MDFHATSHRSQILTVNVEDYFHVWAIRNSIAVRRKHWDRLDPRLDASLAATLELLAIHGAKATFFVFGCIAEAHPELIERIMAHGHEVASRGFWPRALGGLGRAEFIDDLARAKLALERAGANRVFGYRSPVWLRKEHLWMLDALAEAGYIYDSSINPILRRFARQPEYRSVHRVDTPHGALWEYPITTTNLLGLRLAISGGNYVRQFPHFLLSRAVARRVQQGREPVVFYFMPWELDVGQPHISGLSLASNMRQYRNLAKTRWVFEQYLGLYTFRSIAGDLGLPHLQLTAEERPAPLPHAAIEPISERGSRPEATLVIPVFNEVTNVRYLHRTLAGFKNQLLRSYRIHVVLVDDASTDNTWHMLNDQFGQDPDTHLLRHEYNRGVAAAILTGIRAAPTEVVCSIDCDCSYDPSDLAEMLPLIEGADLVTASPYHPQGKVLNVPGWRLFLSKTLSRLYSTVLQEQVYTYTSCCRVYRKQALADVQPSNEGFLGVAETLIEVKRRGSRVVEYPATLESRLFGESKMKVIRTIGCHLRLLGELTMQRIRAGTLLRHDVVPPVEATADGALGNRQAAPSASAARVAALPRSGTGPECPRGA